MSIKGASLRLLPGQTDGGWGSIDPGGLESSSCSQKGVLAGSTTYIEHPAANLVGVDQSHEGGLGSTDVPRRRAPLIRRIEVCFVVFCHESTLGGRHEVLRGTAERKQAPTGTPGGPFPASWGRPDLCRTPNPCDLSRIPESVAA